MVFENTRGHDRVRIRGEVDQFVKFWEIEFLIWKNRATGVNPREGSSWAGSKRKVHNTSFGCHESAHDLAHGSGVRIGKPFQATYHLALLLVP